METILRENITEIDREVLLKNQESINLFLEFGNKWGLLSKIPNSERKYENTGALDYLGYYINHLISTVGVEKAKLTLEQQNQAINMTTKDGPDYTKLKRTILDIQRKDFTTALKTAQKTNDEGNIRAYTFKLDSLKIDESDLIKGAKISLFGFDAMSPNDLPTWLLIIKANHILPVEAAEIIGTPKTPEQLPLDQEIGQQLNKSHAKALKSIKTD